MRAELRRRDAILEAVRVTAERFLDPSSGWEDEIGEVLATLARATGVSRVYLFENRSVTAEEVSTTQRFEWSAEGVSPQIANDLLTNLPMVRTGWGHWVELMRRGEPVIARTRDLAPSERQELEREGILSVALVPVHVDGGWWGFVGFDECFEERVWSAGEVDALRAAASTIGAAIRASRVRDELRAREQEYRAVFHASSDGLVVTDRTTRLVEANEAFHRMHGYEPGELVGASSDRWLAPAHADLPRSFGAAVATEGVLRADAVDVRQDGTTFPVEITASDFTFRGERHVLGVVRDVSERRAARELLTARVDALARAAANLTVDQPLSATLDAIARFAVEASAATSCSIEVADPGTGRGDLLEFPEHAPIHDELRFGDGEHVLVVPLESAGRTLGAVKLRFPEGTEPDEDERTFAAALADQAALAVANATLFEAAQGAAALQERQRLARELHDSVSQALYGIALGARTARTLVSREPAEIVEPLDYVLSLAEAGLEEMRALIFELRPESLANEGLVAALERQARVLRARHHLEVTCALGDEPPIALEAKEALYRVAQESLHNIVKHAEARTVRISLACDTTSVALEVSDDGRGFDPRAEFPGHLGLRSMRERIGGLGGVLAVDSRPGEGTTVRVEVGLEAPVPH